MISSIKFNSSSLWGNIKRVTNRPSVDVGWLLEFYILATSKVLWIWISTWSTRGYGIVLPHQETRLSAPMTWYPTQSYYYNTECLSYRNDAERLARKWYLSMFKSCVWFDQGLSVDNSLSTLSLPSHSRRIISSVNWDRSIWRPVCIAWELVLCI